MSVSEIVLPSVTLILIIAISTVYALGSAWGDRRRKARGLSAPGVYPGSRRHAGDLNLAWWRSLSTAEQEDEDTAALDRAEDAELAAADAVWAAERAAQCAVERATSINAQFHP